MLELEFQSLLSQGISLLDNPSEYEIEFWGAWFQSLLSQGISLLGKGAYVLRLNACGAWFQSLLSQGISLLL